MLNIPLPYIGDVHLHNEGFAIWIHQNKFSCSMTTKKILFILNQENLITNIGGLV